MEGFHTEGVTEGIISDQGELDVTGVKEGVLLGQDILGKIISYLGKAILEIATNLMFPLPPHK